MFHPALWKLIQLQWRGGFRQFGRSLRTFRGLFHLGFVIAMMLYGAGSKYFAGMATSQSPQITGVFDRLQNDFLSLGIFVFTSYTVLFSTGEATVYFTPSEVSFLFPAPVTRKQLLSYKVLKSLLGITALSLFLTVFTATRIGLVLTRMTAVLLTISFLQLLTMNVAFVRQMLREKIHGTIRVVLAVLLGMLVLVALFQTIESVPAEDFGAYVKAFQESTMGSWILAPFQVFVRALRAPDWISFIPSASILLLIDALLLLLAYQLDALSLEAALATSEKMSARMKLMQSKGVWQAFGSSTSAVAQRRVPQLPFWGGVGPIAWQRMTTTFRSSAKLLWLLGGAVAFAAGLVYMIGRSATETQIAPWAGVIAMGYMSFLICLTLQNDIERIGYLKSLPIRSISIVVGDLIGFPILLSIVQSLFIVAEACFFPKLALWLLCGTLLTLPLNFLLFGVDKLVFYIYPTRLAKGAPGDFQNAGKQMIFMALKMLMLGGAALIVAVATLPGALLVKSPLLAVVSAGFVLGIECAVLIPLLIFAFDRFDSSVATAN